MQALTSRWNDRIAAAGDDPAALRELLLDLVRARVRSLTDMVAQRQATWAVVKVQHALGAADKAQHTAREWLQLADSPPVASDGEMRAVRAWLASAGVDAPAQRRLPQPGRGARSDRQRAP
ncbi:MAG: hypothetical protein ACI9K2_006850, partial [Myxococcota bacterium]